MTDQNKPTTADVESVGAANATGGEDVQSNHGASQGTTESDATLTKADLETALGRSFSTKDEALKTLQNLNSLVGDQAVASARGKASAYDNLVKQIASEYDVSEEYADLIARGKAPGTNTGLPIAKSADTNEVKDPVARAKVQDLDFQLQRSELLRKYPEAENVLSEVSDLAKARNASLLDAYEKSSLKKVASTYAEAPKANSVAVPSNRVSAASPNDEAVAWSNYKKNRGADDSIPAAILRNRLGIK